jgi:hypothetical protein
MAYFDQINVLKYSFTIRDLSEAKQFVNYLGKQYNFEIDWEVNNNLYYICGAINKALEKIKLHLPFTHYLYGMNNEIVFDLIPFVVNELRTGHGIVYIGISDDIEQSKKEFDITESRHLSYLLENAGINPTNRFKWSVITVDEDYFDGLYGTEH